MDNPEKILERAKFLKVVFKDMRVSTREELDLEYQTLSHSKDTFISQSFNGISNFYVSPINDGELNQVSFRFHSGLRTIFADEQEEADSNEEYEPILEIIAIFEVFYESTDFIDFSKYEPGDPLIEKFETRVANDAWPYWTEFVQSTCGRLGLSTNITVHKPQVSVQVEKA